MAAKSKIRRYCRIHSLPRESFAYWTKHTVKGKNIWKKTTVYACYSCRHNAEVFSGMLKRASKKVR